MAPRKPKLDAVVEAAEKSVAQVSTTADPKTVLERLQLENDRQREIIKSLEQDRDERKKYAHRVFVMACMWLIFIVVVIFFQGFKYQNFELDPGIIKGILWLTTAKIIAILWLVYKYLFSEKRIK